MRRYIYIHGTNHEERLGRPASIGCVRMGNSEVIDLYEPFILHNDHTFEADRVELLSAALPPEDRGAFGYDASHIDWTDYWLHVHIPALRRWSFPLIEGRPLDV